MFSNFADDFTKNITTSFIMILRGAPRREPKANF